MSEQEDYDQARNAGATHEEAEKIVSLKRDGVYKESSGLHAENAGIPYDLWRRT